MKNFFLFSSHVEAGVISEATPISEVLVNILQFLLSVVAIVAILAIVIAGIRYLFIRDTNQGASVKKSLTAIIIGLVLVMGALVIVWQLGKFLT